MIKGVTFIRDTERKKFHLSSVHGSGFEPPGAGELRVAMVDERRDRPGSHRLTALSLSVDVAYHQCGVPLYQPHDPSMHLHVDFENCKRI